MEYLLIFSTCPDHPTAEKIARQLINEKLAACVNILPGLTSVYHWQGEIETASECLLMAKTEKRHYQSVESTIQKLHPYELPEIIAVSIDRGLPEYLQWIKSCVSTK